MMTMTMTMMMMMTMMMRATTEMTQFLAAMIGSGETKVEYDEQAECDGSRRRLDNDDDYDDDGDDDAHDHDHDHEIDDQICRRC